MTDLQDQQATLTPQPKQQSKRRRKRKRKQKKQQHLNQTLVQASDLKSDPRVLADPNVQAILTMMQNAKTSREALEASLLLDKFLTKEYSALGDPNRADEVNRARAYAHERDMAVEAFETDQDKFIDDVFDRTASNILTGDKADQAKARATSMLKDARDMAVGRKQVKKLRLAHEIENGPKVDVMGEGHWIKVGEAPGVPTLRPDIVRIMDKSWVIEPGLNKDVPKVFADRYELIRRSRQETRAREKAMADGKMEAGQLELALSRIDKAYGVTRQKLGAA